MNHPTFTLILIFSILFSCGLSAQWQSTGDDILDQDHRVWSIKVAPDKSVWVIASYNAFPPTDQTPRVYRSADEGSTWTSSEIPEAVSNRGSDISPIDSSHAFIALTSAGLYQTSNGGQNWEKVTSYNYYSLYVHFFNAQEGWALGFDGFDLVISVTEDGGQSWIDISYHLGIPSGTSLPPFIAGESVTAITFSTNSAYDYDSESIILGTRKGSYWISNDKGKNWKRNSTPLADMGLQTINVAMKDETTLMVASCKEQGSYGNFTKSVSFTTTDGGVTWTEGNPGVTVAASHYIPNSDSIFIVVGHDDIGLEGQGDVGTVISYDYGKNWELIDNTSLVAIDFLDDKTGYGSCCKNSSEAANGQIHKWNLELPTSTIEVVQSEKVTIAPNPVSNYLIISLNNEFQSEDLSIEIISANGQLFSITEVKSDEPINLQMTNLPSGFYTLRIKGNRKSVIKKFIKQ